MHETRTNDESGVGNPIPIDHSTRRITTVGTYLSVVDRFNADARPVRRVTARAEITAVFAVVVCDIVMVSHSRG